MELGNLSKLQYVNLGYSGYGNNLAGDVPVRAFARMPGLAWLSMTDNPGLLGTFFVCFSRVVPINTTRPSGREICKQ